MPELQEAYRMLKYIITVTEDLLITVTLVTLLYTLCQRAYGRRGQAAQLAGIWAGVAASAAMAVVKNVTSVIRTNEWNQWIFYFTILFSLLFVLFSFLFARKEGARWHLGALLACVSGACVTALLIFYELPDVMAYPFNFDTGENGVLSLEFLMRFLGWGLALILMLVYASFLSKCARRVKGFLLPLTMLNLGLLANAVRCFGQILRPWVTHVKWLGWPVRYTKAEFPWVFPFVKFVANSTLLFSLIVAGLGLVIAAVLFFQNTKITDPYDHPAQLRRLRANARRSRRTGCVVLACVVIAAVNLTAVKAYANRAPVLSEPETYVLDGEKILISIDSVNDGNLHRFEYKTEKNVNVRWIIVKKPGAGAYGVGLDACEVCGTAGYYQRGEQVVCKRCDVVMNINTIGFRGGCNPIPIDYVVRDGQIIFQLADIIAAEKEFR